MAPRSFLLAPLVLAAILALGCGSGGDDETPASPLLAIDSRAGANLTVAAAGDFGMEPESIATFRAMRAAAPDAYLGLGDFSYAGPRSEQEFCDLVRSKIGDKPPFEIVSGNHEEDTGEDGRIERFAACLPDALGAVGDYGTQYYFDVGDRARFIMISPDLTIDGEHYYYGANDGGGDTPALRWLKDAIDGAREAGIDWVVVGMHKSCLSTGLYYCDVHQDLLSALLDKRVDLVLSAHDHTYQRSKQLAAPRPGCRELAVEEFDGDCVVGEGSAYSKGAGTVFVISGVAGGEALYPVFDDDPEAGYFEATMGRTSPGAREGFALLTISADRLEGRFVGSTPGSFRDRFEIVADG